jgi:hypothetical protein
MDIDNLKEAVDQLLAKFSEEWVSKLKSAFAGMVERKCENAKERIDAMETTVDVMATKVNESEAVVDGFVTIDAAASSVHNAMQPILLTWPEVRKILD